MNRFDWLEFDTPPMRDEPASKEIPDPAHRRTAPRDSETFYYEARRMRRAGFFGAAAKLYERAIGLDEYHFPAWAEMVDCLIRAGSLGEADQKSKTALDNYRKVRLFYASRALALAHQGAFEEASALSDISMEGQPLWYARCVRAEMLLLLSAEYRGEALTLLEEAINLSVDRWEPSLLGGWMLQEAGWAALAAGYFSEAAHADPRAEAGWWLLGDCFHALRLYEQALFYYQKATEVNPKHELALERQRKCVPAMYGLTRVFRREELRRRWNREYEKTKNKQEPEPYDF